jgi:hypothetical protein
MVALYGKAEERYRELARVEGTDPESVRGVHALLAHLRERVESQPFSTQVPSVAVSFLPRDAAAKKLEELKQSSKESWSETSRKAEAAFEELEKGFKEAWAKLKE